MAKPFVTDALLERVAVFAVACCGAVQQLPGSVAEAGVAAASVLAVIGAQRLGRLMEKKPIHEAVRKVEGSLREQFEVEHALKADVDGAIKTLESALGEPTALSRQELARALKSGRSADAFAAATLASLRATNEVFAKSAAAQELALQLLPAAFNAAWTTSPEFRDGVALALQEVILASVGKTEENTEVIKHDVKALDRAVRKAIAASGGVSGGSESFDVQIQTIRIRGMRGSGSVRATPSRLIGAPQPVSLGPALQEITRSGPPERWVHGGADHSLFVGRRDQLKRLDQHALNSNIRVIGVHAMAGSGKTALITNWLKSPPGGAEYRGALASRRFEGVFFWSFNRDPSQDAAMEALASFIVEELGEAPPEDDIETHRWLCEVCDRRQLCVVFDGLEVLQARTGSLRPGQFAEGPVAEFLEDRCVASGSLILLTSRFPFGDLERYNTETYADLSLEGLSEVDGVALLKAMRARGIDKDLTDYVRSLRGHALGVHMLGLLLKRRRSRRSVLAVTDVVGALQSPDGPATLGEVLSQLFAFYEQQLNPEEIAVLAHLSLFGAANAAQIAHVLETVAEASVARHLQRMCGDNIVFFEPFDKVFSAHPLIAEHFAPRAFDSAERAAAELYDAPASQRPTSPEEVRQVIRKVDLLTRARKFEAASRVLIISLDSGDIALQLCGEREQLECLLAFMATEDVEPGEHTPFEPELLDRRRRLQECKAALGARWLYAMVPRLHGCLVSLQRWDEARRYCELDRELCAELGHNAEDPILLSEAKIEEAIGNLEVCRDTLLRRHERRQQDGDTSSLLTIADVNHVYGHASEAVLWLERWVEAGPGGGGVFAHWLGGWWSLCNIAGTVLRRINGDESKRYWRAYRTPNPEALPHFDVVTQAARAEREIAWVDADWKRVVELDQQFERSTHAAGMEEASASWICGQAEALTKLGRPEVALRHLSRGVALAHPASWTQLWIKLEKLRALLALPDLTQANLDLAYGEATDLVAAGRSRQLLTVTREAARLLKEAATRLDRPEIAERAEQVIAETIRVRGLEDGRAPAFGPLPGEDGWQSRVAEWSVLYQTRRGVSPLDAAAAAYLHAVETEMPTLAADILDLHRDDIFRSADLPRVIRTLATPDRPSPLIAGLANSLSDPATAGEPLGSIRMAVGSALETAKWSRDRSTLQALLEQLGAYHVCALLQVPELEETARSAPLTFLDELLGRSSKPVEWTPDRLPDRLPDQDLENLENWPCVVASPSNTSFGQLPLRPATADEIERVGGWIEDLPFANADEFDPAGLQAGVRPFLADCQLFLAPHRNGCVSVPLVWVDGALQLLRRENDTIYDVWDRRPSAWRLKEIQTLVPFYFSSVVGRLGAFSFPRSQDDIPWTDEAAQEIKDRVGSLLQAVRKIRRDPDGRERLAVTVLFKNALFLTHLLVKRRMDDGPDDQGGFELIDEDVLIEDLPIHFGPEIDLLVRY